MLIECPECGREVSDRAAACVGCGFPIAEHAAQLQGRQNREHVGEVDCPYCEARGFVMVKTKSDDEQSGFYWCDVCKHTGRAALFKSDRGYWAVALDDVEAFARGDDLPEARARYIGVDPPEGHRYEDAGPRHD